MLIRSASLYLIAHRLRWPISAFYLKKSTMPSSMEQSPDDSNDKKDVYEKAEAYWAHVPCDVDGMLGGFGHLHLPDMIDSKKFISHLKAKRHLINFERAIDCGCGIGRVTKHLLLPLFKTVDMVDVTENFIAGSSKYIGGEDKRVGQKFVCGLQDFEPQERFYDLIWVQWVTGHLTDEDFERFFRRCKEGLREGGCIVLKENVSSSADKYDFDSEDNSWTRPKERIVQLLRMAGLSLLSDRKQTHFPRGMLAVYMFAVK
uniref:Alpha N-terminal protein methyltransferase 1 n=1 Tax=Ascaris suum TaxID=6253 RepID=F1LAA5_ASCSU